METKAKISFGFTKAVPAIGGTSTSVNKASSSKPLFNDQDDDTGSAPLLSLSGAKSKKKSIMNGSSIFGAATLSRSAKRTTDDASQANASIFDYDGVYDSMKVGQKQANLAREEEKKKRDPKYISAFLASSEQRKLDRSRAEAKMIQRERELEGEEFAGTEAFVTDAYKKQMEEINEAEEKEKKREEENRIKSKGVAGFYKDFMEENDRAHQAAVAASLKSGSQDKALSLLGTPVDAVVGKNESSDSKRQQAIEEARRSGKDVRVNDDNEVVDERSLLSAGLNTFGSRKKKEREEEERRKGRDSYHEDMKGFNKVAPRDGAREAREAREAQRQRQLKLIEEQMLEMEKKREEEARQEEEQKRRAIFIGRRNDSNSIASARERALERKRKREEEEVQKKQQKEG